MLSAPVWLSETEPTLSLDWKSCETYLCHFLFSLFNSLSDIEQKLHLSLELVYTHTGSKTQYAVRFPGQPKSTLCEQNNHSMSLLKAYRLLSSSHKSRPIERVCAKPSASSLHPHASHSTVLNLQNVICLMVHKLLSRTVFNPDGWLCHFLTSILLQVWIFWNQATRRLICQLNEKHVIFGESF